MNAEMQRFNDAVKKDAKLQGELKAAAKDLNSLVAFANAKGYKFTAQDVEAAKPKGGELNEKDLGKVSGGGSFIGSGSFLGGSAGGLISW
jgi:predicted ribosomally synthesized peptide with nif11-like leader